MSNYIAKPKTQHELQMEYIKAYECYPSSWELYEMDVDQRGFDIREEDAWLYNYERDIKRRNDDEFELLAYKVLQRHIAKAELQGHYISAELAIELQNLLYEALTEPLAISTIREQIETVMSWHPDWIVHRYVYKADMTDLLVTSYIEVTLVGELTGNHCYGSKEVI